MQRWKKLTSFGGGGGGSGSMPLRKKFEICASETLHFEHSGAKIRVFGQNTDIIKFQLFYSVTAHKYYIFRINSSCQLLWTIGCFSICFKSYKKWGNFQRDIEDITRLRGDTNFIFSCWKYLSRVCFAHSWEILSAREDKIRNPKRPCNALYIL